VSVLADILKRKQSEVDRLRAGGTAELERAARAAPPVRDFVGALRHTSRPRVIAEFKRASPSAGPLREAADPAAIARAYEAAGACALSVLTDRDFFRGSLDDLRAARGAVDLPALRKDFVIDELQLLEARAAGADAILLIVAALDDAALEALYAAARDLDLAALVEVHTRAELGRALEVGADLIGINNRDLRSFRTDVAVTRGLLPHLGDCTAVSESGISEAETIRELDGEGVHAFLVGEALMRAPDPGRALAALRGEPACE
jgi:indole-3-glycerol phosphate synthase